MIIEDKFSDHHRYFIYNTSYRYKQKKSCDKNVLRFTQLSYKTYSSVNFIYQVCTLHPFFDLQHDITY